ncbi:hypothetical protein GmRootA79_41340 [Acidovorax sp. A79]
MEGPAAARHPGAGAGLRHRAAGPRRSKTPVTKAGGMGGRTRNAGCLRNGVHSGDVEARSPRKPRPRPARAAPAAARALHGPGARPGGRYPARGGFHAMKALTPIPAPPAMG